MPKLNWTDFDFNRYYPFLIPELICGHMNIHFKQ